MNYTNQNLPSLTHLSLFSGIGGIDLAAEWAGFETVAFVEQNPFCQKVLTKNFPGIPIYDDITRFDAEPFRGAIDLISGGFPCQDISFANPFGKGLEGNRSGLWFEMLRVIEQARPTWVLAENVRNLISMGIDTCFLGMEALGYEVTALVVPACGVGAVHRRERVFIVAHASDAGLQRERTQGATPDSYLGNQWKPIRTGDYRTWGIEPAIRRRDDGVSRGLDKDRLKALGSAVCPQQVFPILEAIAESHRRLSS